MKNKIKLFLVDDDALFLKILEIELLEEKNFEIKTFATGELCIQNLHLLPDVIVLDYNLDGVDKTAMNGIETLDSIKRVKPDLPVIILSGQDKIEVAIECMHHGALDYIVKSETLFLRLTKNIKDIIQSAKTKKQLQWYMDKM